MEVLGRVPNMRLMVSYLHCLLTHSPNKFAHAYKGGYTYCAIGTLSSLGRLPKSIKREPLGSNLVQPAGNFQRGLTNLPAVTLWLMSRQLAYAEEVEDDDDLKHGHPLADVRGTYSQEDHYAYDVPSLAGLTLEEPQSIAFNGRLNKPADTCYSWWGVSSLEVRYLYHCALYWY